jgi:hypothetical protein
MKTIQKRVEELEETMPKNTNHKYLMVIRLNEFDKVENQYFRDGEPISRAEYEREAPKTPGKININWSEVNPRDNDENDKNTG